MEGIGMPYYRKVKTDTSKIKISHREFKLVKFSDTDEEYLVFLPENFVKKVVFSEEAYILPSDVDVKMIQKLIKKYQKDVDVEFGDLLQEEGIPYHIADKHEYVDEDALVVFPDKDIKQAIVHMSELKATDFIDYWDGYKLQTIRYNPKLTEIIDVIVNAKPSTNLKNGNIIYKVISIDNRKPENNEDYLLYKQPEEGVARAKFLDIDKVRELVLSDNN